MIMMVRPAHGSRAPACPFSAGRRITRLVAAGRQQPTLDRAAATTAGWRMTHILG
jgi:hypothetical protein